MTRGIHWFRNDLRLRDNTALAALVARSEQWLPVFVRDVRLERVSPRRTAFLHDCLARLRDELGRRGVPLVVREGRAEEVLPRLVRQTRAELVSWSEESTPHASQRDTEVLRRIEKEGARVETRLDHVIFRSAELRTGTGGAYAVYTPYRNAWWKHWQRGPRLPERAPRLPPPIPGLEAGSLPEPVQGLGSLPTGGEAAALRRLRRFLEADAARYAEARDFPALDATSRLSPYLRLGVLSPRECVAEGLEAVAADPHLEPGVSKWLDQLVWRDFYAGILEEHPRVLRHSHRREYDRLVWNDSPEAFAAWCEGRTGFPIVDAGMRQLSETGWMHNRVRMIVASFLTKDLLIDWRAGERFFLEQLVDGDPASNNGGWQWAASTGTDAQPWFRIFNPVAQGRRWDAGGAYVRRWVPELAGVPDEHIHTPSEFPLAAAGYPAPIVDHAEARKLALERFKAAREGRA